MIEVIILNYLKTKLSVPIALEKTGSLPQKYVLFEKLPSSRTNHLYSSRFAFQSYSDSKYGAALLNEEVKKAVDSMIELDDIAGIKLDSDYDFTDTTTKEYRYQAVYDIKHY